MDEEKNMFQNYRMLDALERHLEVESTPGIFYNRLAREEGKSHTSVGEFGAWSMGHISTSATLPLHNYFA